MSAAGRAGLATAARPHPVPVRPTRGPSRRKVRSPAVPARLPVRVPASTKTRASDVVRAIPDLPLLDRLVRSKTWIVMLGALLAGIVWLNVASVQQDQGIATRAREVTSLKRDNAFLRAKTSRLASPAIVQRKAAQAGFYMPEPGAVRYLRPYATPTRTERARAIAAAGFGGG